MNWTRFIPRAIAVIVAMGVLVGIDALVRSRSARIELWLGFKEGLKQAKNESKPTAEPTPYSRPDQGVFAQVPEGYRLHAVQGAVIARKDIETEGEEGSSALLVTAAKATTPRSAGPYLQEWMGAIPGVLDIDGTGPVALGDTALHDEGTSAWRVFDGHCGKTAVHGEAIAVERRERLELRAFWAPKDDFDKDRHILFDIAQSVSFRHATPVRVHEGAQVAMGVPEGYQFEDLDDGAAVAQRGDPDVRVECRVRRSGARRAGQAPAGPDAKDLFKEWLDTQTQLTGGLVTTTVSYPSIVDARGLTWMPTGAIITFDHGGHYGRAMALACQVRSSTDHATVIVVRRAPADTADLYDAQLTAIEGTIRIPRLAGAAGRSAIPLSHPSDPSPLVTHWTSWRAEHTTGIDGAPLALLLSEEHASPHTHDLWAMPLLDAQPDGTYVPPSDPTDVLTRP